jgi:hypothetical protein
VESGEWRVERGEKRTPHLKFDRRELDQRAYIIKDLSPSREIA